MKLFPTRLSRVFAGVAAAILLYTAIGFLLFPVILKRVAVQELTKFLGRTVTIRTIDFNPYAMSVAVHGFQVNEPKGDMILSLDTLSATLNPLPLFLHHTWVFKKAFLLGLSANIVRNTGGSLNFTDLLRLDWPKSVELQFGLIRLVNGRIFFRDAAVPGGFSTTISRLTANLKDFSTLAGHDNSFSVSAESESGEKLSWNGSFRVHPLSSQGQIAAEDVLISRYYPYFEDRFDFTIAEGDFTARASYDVDLARERFTLLLRDGTLAARSLKVYEHGSAAPLFGFAGLALSGAQVDLVRRTINVASMRMTGGSAVVRRLADGTFNVQHLVKPALPPLPTKAATSPDWSMSVGEIRLSDFAAEVNHVFGRETVKWKELLLTGPTFKMNPPTASVNQISLRDGELVFTDPSVEPPVRIALTLLSIQVGAFSSSNPVLVASVAVHARIENAAPLQISGKTNPIGQQGETNVRGLVQDFSLVPLSPYAAKYLGYELTAGDLGLEIKCLIRGRKLDFENTIEIDRLTLGAKTESKEATKLPVHLAIALLKDSNGTITLHIPIAIALDGPKLELQKAFIEGVLHPFTTTAESPFAALGAQLGGGGEELGFQEFSPGSADLLPQETGKLDIVLQGLKRWPEILLDIEGSVDLKNDTGDLQLLAAERAESVREYLLRQGTLEPQRIFLIDDSPENVPRKGSRTLLYLKDKYGGPR